MLARFSCGIYLEVLSVINTTILYFYLIHYNINLGTIWSQLHVPSALHLEEETSPISNEQETG
jgi:hypothetical protein